MKFFEISVQTLLSTFKAYTVSNIITLSNLKGSIVL